MTPNARPGPLGSIGQPVPGASSHLTVALLRRSLHVLDSHMTADIRLDATAPIEPGATLVTTAHGRHLTRRAVGTR